jgi:hypothetical protein
MRNAECLGGGNELASIPERDCWREREDITQQHQSGHTGRRGIRGPLIH